MGNELSNAVDGAKLKQQMYQHESDTEYLSRLKQQEEQRTGVIYEHIVAKMEADCACQHPLRFFSPTLRSECVSLRMEARVKKAEVIIYERAFKTEMFTARLNKHVSQQ